MAALRALSLCDSSSTEVLYKAGSRVRGLRSGRTVSLAAPGSAFAVTADFGGGGVLTAALFCAYKPDERSSSRRIKAQRRDIMANQVSGFRAYTDHYPSELVEQGFVCGISA